MFNTVPDYNYGTEKSNELSILNWNVYINKMEAFIKHMNCANLRIDPIILIKSKVYDIIQNEQ